MSSGFNTDVTHNGEMFHIQTEDRGEPHHVIDTGVYQNGRVLLRKSLSYAEFQRSAEFTGEWLRQRVEEHHRFIVEDLRTGVLDEEISIAKASESGSGIQIELLNPDGWLADGNVSLEIEILRTSDRQPEPAAQVEAEIEGAIDGRRHAAATDRRGRARIQFALPPLGKGEHVLVISATSAEGRERIRFAMRSKARTPAAGATRQS